MKRILASKLLIFVLFIAVFYRFYQLDTLPGEIFGDISQKLIHVNSVLHGHFQIVYGYDVRQGMIFYLTAPFAALFGNTYFVLKCVMAAVGVFSVYAMYLLGKEISNHEAGLVAAFILAVSKWHVVFSRIGYRASFTPLFVTLTLYFMIRAYRTRKWRHFIATGFILGLGMYTYYAFIVMIGALALICLLMFIWDRAFIQHEYKKIIIALEIFVLVLAPMAVDYYYNRAQYTSHAGPMMLKDGKLPKNAPKVFVTNIKNQLLMFNYKGDAVFRVNPVHQPQLDIISGVFFLVGILYWSVKKRGVPAYFLFVPFFLLQLPSVLVLNFPADIPSATRSIGVIPLVCLFVADGLIWVSSILKKNRFRVAYIVMILLVIAGLNYYDYFVTYANGLPYHNAAAGTRIAREIDVLPKTTQITIVGCCWGPWGEPDKADIRFAQSIPHAIKFVEKEEYECSDVQKVRKYTLFLSPASQNELKKYIGCLQNPHVTKRFTEKGDFIYIKVTGENKKY